ncbi:hypothetical protein BJV74DRAFT_890987 [Russula compacta]|nr:hypothetical protein BJV74DRAFT_890987 [Russula compacta]
MHTQQPTHRAHNAASFDILQSPFYANLPDLGGRSRATQPPHPSPPFVQQQYAPSDPPLEAQRSPPRPYSLQEPPLQRHSHLGNTAPPPALQQPQPRPAAAYPVFPQDYEGHNQTLQGLPPHLSRLPQPPPMPLSPWVVDPFSDDASTQPTALRRGISRIYDLTYTSHPQPRYQLPTANSSALTHTPPEQSPIPGPPTFHEQHVDSATTDLGQRPRSWGGAGSLDPATGVFSRAADHPRIRTAQACEKCRARKAKCSGDHPTCQRCLQRGLVCTYAAERRMRGPNKPKATLPDGSQPPAAEGQKTRKRASTMPSALRRGLQISAQQQRQRQPQEQGVAAASPASPASSAGSGSLCFPLMSESEASPMTPHSSVDVRHPPGVGFPTSPRILVQDYAAMMRPGLLGHVSESNGYEEDGPVATDGIVAGVYGQDISLDLRTPYESTKTLF